MSVDKVSTPELAQMLGASERQLRSLVEKGELTADMESGHYRFDVDLAMRQYADYERSRGRRVGYKLPNQGWWESLSERKREETKEDDFFLSEDWKNRVLAFRACQRLLNRLVDDSGNLKANDGATVKAIIEEETLMHLKNLQEYYEDTFVFQNRYLCPKYGRYRSGNVCPNNEKCLDSSAFQLCFAASSKSDFIESQDKAPSCCFCGAELSIAGNDWRYVKGDTPWPIVQDCGSLCCFKCANEKLDRHWSRDAIKG